MALLITIIFVALVWFVGPLVAIAGHEVLSSLVARLVGTLILVFLWGMFVVVYYARKNKKELANPEKAAAKEKELSSRSRLKEEIDLIRERFKSAIRIVTTSNFYGPGSRSRYALPWYLVLGSKDCGKTSLMLNSGMQFPLNEQADRYLYELKSTEHCEWLYGNQAVFLDTPGSYTEHSDNEKQRIWQAFLKRLFRVKPASPLSGIIMCVSIRDILEPDGAKREHLARNIRSRLSEALKSLRAYVPVYLLFTKCDAVPGFAEFFAHLPRSEREQIFGCPSQSDTMEPGTVRTEIKDLLQRLNTQIVGKIHQERDIPSRGGIFRFPQELAALGPRIDDFIFEAFGPSRYHRPVMFRGFFFTSALSVQDVLGASAKQGEYKFQTGFQASLGDYAKGFFTLRLLEDYIIPEARLGGADKERIWGLRFRRYAMQLTACAAFLFIAAFLGISFVNNYSRVDSLDKIYTVFDSEREKVTAPIDSKSVLPELGVMEKATEIYSPAEDSAISYGLGLYQGKTFNKATNAAFLGILNNRFLPPIRVEAAQKVDEAISGNISDLKSALRAYIMLCQPKYMNEGFLIGWLERQWSGRYLGQADTQSGLKHYMEYLLEHGIVPVEPDQALLDRARQALLKIPLADLAYQRMQEEAEESGVPPFTFRNSLGEAMSPFEGDTYPISCLYTKEGHAKYLIERCPKIIISLTDENWIFGSNALSLSELDVDKVYKSVRAMYFRDYTKYWSEAVQKLSIRTPTTLDDAAKLADQLTSGASPAVLVLRDLRANTDLIVEQSKTGKALTDAAINKAGRRVAPTLGSQGAKILKEQAKEGLAENIENAQKDALTVKQYFTALDALLDENGNASPPLKAANDDLLSAGAYWGKLGSSDDGVQSVFNALLAIINDKDDTLRKLETSATRLPVPIRNWYLPVLNGGLQRMLSIAAENINRNYHERVLSVYNRDLRGLYPFDSASDKDVNLNDFAAFFCVGGTLDSFHDAYLSPFINKNGTPRTIMGRTLPVSSASIASLQKANRVQSAFFTSGRDLGINFLMEPYAMDASLKRVALANADKAISYWHGPVTGVGFSWPQGGGNQASLSTEDLSGVTSQKATRGEWALFRLLQGGTIKSHEGTTCLIELQQNGKWAQFLIQFRNKENPFDPSVCSFALPDSI